MPSTQDHPPILETRHVDWTDEAACAATARALAQRPAVREAVIELRGPLGTGKTSFVRHLLHALGVTGRVKSPTYAVLEAYELPDGPVWHFDFYRFNDPQEWEDAGFRDIYAGAGLKIAEWPEKAAGLLPAPDLRIEIEFQPEDVNPRDEPRDNASNAARDDTSEGASDGTTDNARAARFTALSARGRELLP